MTLNLLVFFKGLFNINLLQTNLNLSLKTVCKMIFDFIDYILIFIAKHRLINSLNVELLVYLANFLCIFIVFIVFYYALFIAKWNILLYEVIVVLWDKYQNVRKALDIK